MSSLRSFSVIRRLSPSTCFQAACCIRSRLSAMLSVHKGVWRRYATSLSSKRETGTPTPRLLLLRGQARFIQPLLGALERWNSGRATPSLRSSAPSPPQITHNFLHYVCAAPIQTLAKAEGGVLG